MYHSMDNVDWFVSIFCNNVIVESVRKYRGLESYDIHESHYAIKFMNTYIFYILYLILF